MIGYYVHHQGEGHRQRATAIAAAYRGPMTLIGTGLGDELNGIPCLDLPDDRLAQGHFDGRDGATRPPVLHYAPLHHKGVRERVALIANWIAAAQPALMIVDALGSSESSGTGVVITTAQGSSGGGKFQPLPGRETKLFDENLQEIPQGSEGVGIVARTGPLPLGYLGEDAKNAQTFPVIGGKRWLMTGDRARWTADGTLEFIGRDNMCINTGGEKVFPEEVEAVLLDHPAVKDVRVVSLPDARFGRKIVAVQIH